MNMTSNPAPAGTPAVPRVQMPGTARGCRGGVATVVGLYREPIAAPSR
jgi:hypothetical protein